MHQQSPRRSKRTSRRREQLNSSSGDSRDSSPSRVITSSSPYTLPSSIDPSSSTSLMTTTQSNTATQTTQDTPLNQSFQSKSVPSFAETQLLSVYYLNRNITNQPVGSTNQDSCVFVEQQERQPIRFRATYDPSASTRSTQTSPPLPLRQLSTHGSTLIVDANQQYLNSNNQLYEQRLRIHSGSQRLANNPALIDQIDEPLSPSELVEESRYSYEEYIIHVGNDQEQKKQASSSSATSTSSVTTIIAQPSSQSPPPTLTPVPESLPPRTTSKLLKKRMHQPDELDSDRTSRLSGDEINTHSSASSMSGSFTNQDWQTATNTSALPSHNLPIVNTRQTTTSTREETTRVSSWPPVPYDMPTGDTQFETSFVLDESDETRRLPRVQFAEQLVRVIPPSATNSLSEESASIPIVPTVLAPAIIPRTSTIRTNIYEQNEQQTNLDLEEEEEEDTTTTSTTTGSSNVAQVPGRLQRTSGLTNLNEVLIARPTAAPPPPPPPATPPSTSSSASGVDSRIVGDQLKKLDYQLLVDTRPPANQSKWVKDHMDVSDAQATTTTTPGRVDTLRSLFEQQSGRSSDSSTLNSPTGQARRTEPEERPSRYGDEIRFRVKQPKTSTIHHAEPVQIVQRSKPATTAVAPLTWEDLLGVQGGNQPQQQPQPPRRPQATIPPFELDDIQRITGRQIRSLDDIGEYLQDGRTWKWNETFWFTLTVAQRDQLRYLQQQSRSRQDSGDTQINEHSDRSAYQGDSEDNSPKIDHAARRVVRPRNFSQENPLPSTNTQVIVDETKRFKSTINDPGSTVSITGAGAWQQGKQPIASTGIGKYTETSIIHESRPSVSVFGSTPTTTYTRVGSQDSIASSTTQQQQQQVPNKRLENPTTIIESGYSSADEPQQQQQRSNLFRPNSSTIIEEPSASHHIDSQSGIGGFVGGPGSVIISSNDIQLREQPIYENLRPENLQQNIEPDLDPASYEQFICDYLSTHARRLRSDDGTLILLIDGQQIQMPHIRLPSSDNITLAKNVYLDSIDEYPPPFETESDQLVIFIHGESIVLPADRWSFYKRKYRDTDWIDRLERVNRRIPNQLMPIIEDWLAEHTAFLLDTNEMNVDGLNIPLTGKLGAHILDLYQVRQLQSNQNFYWSEILKFLIRTGYVSFDPDEQIVHIAHSELDARRILNARPSPTPELIDRLATLLRSLDNIQFDNANGTLILDDQFTIPHEYIEDLFEQHQQGQTLNANELASVLLRVCEYEDDQDGQALILSIDDQVLQLTPPRPPSPPPSPPSIQEAELVDDDEDIEIDEALLQWLSSNVRWSSEQGRIFLLRYRTMPNYLIRIGGPEGQRLSNLLHRQALQVNDILHWHENHVQIDQMENSLRMIIKPNNNIEIVNLPLEENEKKREKVNEERRKATNQKSRNNFQAEEKKKKKKKKEKIWFFLFPYINNLQATLKKKKEEEKKKKKGEKKNILLHHYPNAKNRKK